METKKINHKLTTKHTIGKIKLTINIDSTTSMEERDRHANRHGIRRQAQEDFSITIKSSYVQAYSNQTIIVLTKQQSILVQ